MYIYIIIYIVITLWLFNIAMEHGPFIDDFPSKTSIYKGFSMAMLIRWYIFVCIYIYMIYIYIHIYIYINVCSNMMIPTWCWTLRSAAAGECFGCPAADCLGQGPRSRGRALFWGTGSWCCLGTAVSNGQNGNQTIEDVSKYRSSATIWIQKAPQMEILP